MTKPSTHFLAYRLPGDDDMLFKDDLALLAIVVESEHTSILVTNDNSDNIILLNVQEKK